MAAKRTSWVKSVLYWLLVIYLAIEVMTATLRYAVIWALILGSVLYLKARRGRGQLGKWIRHLEHELRPGGERRTPARTPEAPRPTPRRRPASAGSARPGPGGPASGQRRPAPGRTTRQRAARP